MGAQASMKGRSPVQSALTAGTLTGCAEPPSLNGRNASRPTGDRQRRRRRAGAIQPQTWQNGDRADSPRSGGQPGKCKSNRE